MILCCPTITATAPAEDVNVAAPTETQAEAPTVDAMTSAPTPAEDDNVKAPIKIPTETPTETPTLDAKTPAPNSAPAKDSQLLLWHLKLMIRASFARMASLPGIILFQMHPAGIP